jgi:hypothetical protein
VFGVKFQATSIINNHWELRANRTHLYRLLSAIGFFLLTKLLTLKPASINKAVIHATLNFGWRWCNGKHPLRRRTFAVYQTAFRRFSNSKPNPPMATRPNVAGSGTGVTSA